MKLRDSFLYLVRGALIGISCLVPGISCGAIASSLGAYDNFIINIWQTLKRKTNATYIVIIPITIGLLAGIFGGSHVVNFFITKYKMQTIFLFVGLLAGGYRLTIKNANLKLNKKSVSLFLLSFIFLLLLQMLVIDKFSITSSNSLLNNLFTGLLSGIIFLIPGLSTSSILLFFNKYDYVLYSLNHMLNLKSLITVLLFVVGALIGIIIISRIISYYLKNYKTTTYTVIAGFITASVVIAITQIDKIIFTFPAIFTSILAFLWGYILSKNLEKE